MNSPNLYISADLEGTAGVVPCEQLTPGANDLNGVLAHTLHGGGIREVRLNDEPASETVISAATTCHYGVSMGLAGGDDAYVQHSRSVLGSPDCQHLPGPIIVEVDCLYRRAAEILAYLPGVDRPAPHTVRFVAADVVEVSEQLQFLLNSRSLVPK